MLKVYVIAAQPGISWLTQEDNSYLAPYHWTFRLFPVFNAVRPSRRSLGLRPLHRHYLIQPSHCLIKMNYFNSSQRLGEAKDPQLASGRGKVWLSSRPCFEAPHCRMNNESARKQAVLVCVPRNLHVGESQYLVFTPTTWKSVSPYLQQSWLSETFKVLES